jgi:hypothetical protein
MVNLLSQCLRLTKMLKSMDKKALQELMIKKALQELMVKKAV